MGIDRRVDHKPSTSTYYDPDDYDEEDPLVIPVGNYAGLGIQLPAGSASTEIAAYIDGSADGDFDTEITFDGEGSYRTLDEASMTPFYNSAFLLITFDQPIRVILFG